MLNSKKRYGIEHMVYCYIHIHKCYIGYYLARYSIMLLVLIYNNI